MKKASLLFSLFLLCISTSLLAQPPCGFDQLHKKLLAENPAYARTIEQNEVSLRNYISTHPDLGKNTSRQGAALFTIPVVVHVVHTGGAIGSIYNPTDAQIIGAINYLNAVYDGTNPGTELGAGDMQIQFALAQRDPNCNPTNGIDRVDGSGVPGYLAAGVNVTTSGGATELSVKNLSRWNTADYYNIWVVSMLDGADGTSGQFIAGFAYFPGAPSTLDGTIMLATQMKANQKTLPHEIGHALNLYHPFEGSPDNATCPANATCTTQGDRICDTDPITYNQSGGIVDFSCRTGVNICGGNYSINTEHNYMNYTSCFTLFTVDQKTRALAAMSLPSRASLASSLGATPTYSGGTQCTPKINFELNADGVTETTVSTTGCRSYRDYTYNMTIGNNPSVAATATLAVSGGTATEGVDFDITTNGNFAAPSKVVTFPTGGHANQPFTIRIYDDASVESSETFTFNFTVNNGGGNAALGTGKPTLTMTITDNDVAPVVPGTTGTGIIGASAGTVTPPTFDARLQSQRTQISYKATELTAAGVPAGSITGISFNLVKASTRAFTNLTIKLGQTTVPYLINGSVTVVSPMTTVKTLATYNTIMGLNTFTFDTPFTWDGTSNLAVEICFDNGTAAAGDGVDAIQAFLDGGSSTQGNMFYQANINCGQAFSSVGGFINGIKPITRLNYGNTGNPVATTTITSKSEYLGPNADVYFYSNTGQTLARITNLTSFDYGCTQVSIDRTGTTSAQFWNSTASNYLASKSFRVIPTNNTTTGHYQVSLYYTQTEVNGWQTATGQTLASARVVKVSNGAYVPDVTPAAPHLSDIMTVNASNAAFGTDYVITGDFTSTGFSGFGVGIPGIASTLPITLLSFDGRKDGNTVKLDWKTATEFNNDHFEIETSKDNSHFYAIGSIASRGNSTSDQAYTLTDNLPAKGVNYYRLKQVDIDGKLTYSRVISVSFDGKINIVQAYPNPVRDKMIIELAMPSSNVMLKIFTLDGKMLRQENEAYIQRSHAININELSSGTYILQVQTGEDIYTLKFVKQ